MRGSFVIVLLTKWIRVMSSSISTLPINTSVRPICALVNFKLAAFKDADEAILPMGCEPLSLTVNPLLGALFVRQSILIAAREGERFAVIE
jgi:hypothetical protein